jgi:DNA processing protein
LAKQILDSGGALISEYREEDEILKVNFIARNRIVSGLAEVLLITEAARNSGSLHTARFALEQGKTVMAVPGNINSPASEGCNNLIKSGAIPVTSVDDIFFALGMDTPSAKTAKSVKGTPQQQQIFNLISSGVKDQEDLVVASQLTVPEINSSLTALELQGYVRPLGGGTWTIV